MRLQIYAEKYAEKMQRFNSTSFTEGGKGGKGFTPCDNYRSLFSTFWVMLK